MDTHRVTCLYCLGRQNLEKNPYAITVDEFFCIFLQKFSVQIEIQKQRAILDRRNRIRNLILDVNRHDTIRDITTSSILNDKKLILIQKLYLDLINLGHLHCLKLDSLDINTERISAYLSNRDAIELLDLFIKFLHDVRISCVSLRNSIIMLQHSYCISCTSSFY